MVAFAFNATVPRALDPDLTLSSSAQTLEGLGDGVTAAEESGLLETFFFLVRRTVSTVLQSTRTSGSKNASCRPNDRTCLQSPFGVGTNSDSGT